MRSSCPAPGCARSKPREMYACREHWFQLPKAIRDRIWRGYREDMSVWLAADREAVAHWGKIEKMKEETE